MAIIKDQREFVSNEQDLWTNSEGDLWMPDTPVVKFVSFVVEKRNKFFETNPRIKSFTIKARNKFFELFPRLTTFMVNKRNKYFNLKQRDR